MSKESKPKQTKLMCNECLTYFNVDKLTDEITCPHCETHNLRIIKSNYVQLERGEIAKSHLATCKKCGTVFNNLMAPEECIDGELVRICPICNSVDTIPNGKELIRTNLYCNHCETYYISEDPIGPRRCPHCESNNIDEKVFNHHEDVSPQINELPLGKQYRGKCGDCSSVFDMDFAPIKRSFITGKFHKVCPNCGMKRIYYLKD